MDSLITEITLNCFCSSCLDMYMYSFSSNLVVPKETLSLTLNLHIESTAVRFKE